MVLLKVCILGNYRFLILLCITAVLFSCQEEKKTVPPVKQTIVKKVVRKKKTKAKKTAKIVYPSTATAVDFFTEYGKKNPETRVLISTDFGDMEIELFKDTPIHRASFIYLVKEGCFDMSGFYRIIEDFVIQAGRSDLESLAAFKNLRKNYKIPPEFRKNHVHKRGTVAAARDWTYNPSKLSTAFEFYILVGTDDYTHIDGEHTIFGRVVKGMSTADKISRVKTAADDWPLKDVNMKVKVIR
jgi:peptidylprolyl isomerase